jgi:hypothetical protein
MTILVVHQPKIGDGLDDHTDIYLTLFNTILETTHTRTELHESWEVISQDTRIKEMWEAKKRLVKNKPHR